MTNYQDGSRRESVDYKTYLKAHIRTSKTLMSNADGREFVEDEEREVALEDWTEDCERYKLKVTECLSKAQYYSSMYQLVEIWSDHCKLSYVKFLSWVFENISRWSYDYECYVFRNVDDVEAVGDKFEELKEEVAICIEIDELCIKMMDLVLKMMNFALKLMDFCIKNDELCIKNGDLNGNIKARAADEVSEK